MLAEEWCSGFSVFSILVQVQAGLFDFMGGQTETIKQEATASQTFDCPQCDHNGTGNTWPPFDNADFKSYKDLTEEEKKQRHEM